MAPAHPSTAATQTLQRRGIIWTAHTYAHDPRSPSYGIEAAQALSIDPERVFKTLVVTVAGKPGLAIIPVSRSLNLKSAAAALARAGAPKSRSAEMADERLAQSVTGYVVGGISPIGTKRPLPCVLDQSASALDTLLVSGGRRGFDIELSPDDLCALTRAVLAQVTR